MRSHLRQTPAERVVKVGSLSPRHTLAVCATEEIRLADDVASHHREEPTGKRLLALSLLALGIVYGDIGTSPLYAVRECFYGSHAVALTRGNIFGVLSLIFWSLVVVVTLK